MPPKKSKGSEAKRLQILIKKRENERKRREAIGSDPELLSKQKEKERLKYLAKKAKGIVKPISELSAREQRKKRKQWKENTQRLREKKKDAERSSRLLQENSPPYSDMEDNRMNFAPNNQPSDAGSPLPSTSANQSPSLPKVDGRKPRGRKRLRRDRSKLVRDLKATQLKLEQANRRTERLKKKLQRLQAKQNKATSSTPRTKVKHMLKGAKFVSPQVKKSLLFAEVLSKELEEGYTSLSDEKSKQMFAKMFKGRLLKKYKLLNKAKHFLTSKRVRANKLRKLSFKYERKRRTGCVVTNELKQKVINFLEEDSNSRMCPGKKDTVTLKKNKQQKRFLCDTLANLHSKFCEEYPEMKVSYTTFTRLRPFWIITPTVSERETVLCRTHENMNLLLQRLHEKKVVAHKDPDILIETICCKKGNISCLQRKCDACKGKTADFDEYCDSEECSYMKWNTVNERYVDKKGEEKISKKAKKEEIVSTMAQTVACLEAELPKYMNHVANIIHQHKQIKRLKGNLKTNEVVLHVDFSENYVCKYANEIQAVHFVGGQQITLHTGVLYYKENDDEPVKPESFCTLSESLRHDAAAIWAHLRTVLEQHIAKHPQVDTIFGLSDSPSTQYRNKTLFHILTTLVAEDFPNISSVVWNYSESGHGKGAPDGIGGVLKRTADRLVAAGTDVADYQTLLTKLKQTVKNIKLSSVAKEAISEVDLRLECSVIRTFPGTMKVHQVSWSNASAGTVSFRKLSCFDCNPGTHCKHYGMGKGVTSLGLNSAKQLESPGSRNGEASSSKTGLLDLKGGDYVLVMYDDRYYPGKVTNSASNSEGEIEVMAMEQVGKENFRWPRKPDLFFYPPDDIKLKISSPQKCPQKSSTRQCNDLFYFDDFPWNV